MKLKCSKVLDKISAFVDDMLSPEEKDAFLAHMATCRRCKLELEKYQQMIAIIRNTEHLDAPDNLWERVRQRLEERAEERVKFTLRVPRWVFAPAGFVAVLFLLLSVWTVHVRFNQERERIPLAFYVQEHMRSYSPTVMLYGYDNESVRAVRTDESSRHVPELEVLLEVHYGNVPANGS